MLKKVYTLFGCLAVLALAAPAQAGGVIIDGWEGDNFCEESESCTALRSGEQDDDGAQEFYLLAAVIFHGHDAARTESDGLSEEDLSTNDTAEESQVSVDQPDAPIPASMIEELEANELGGCAAAPGGLAGLAALLLLRRRRG